MRHQLLEEMEKPPPVADALEAHTDNQALRGVAEIVHVIGAIKDHRIARADQSTQPNAIGITPKDEVIAIRAALRQKADRFALANLEFGKVSQTNLR